MTSDAKCITIEEYIESPETPPIVSGIMKELVEEFQLDTSCDVYGSKWYKLPPVREIPIEFSLLSNECGACVWCGHQATLKAYSACSGHRGPQYEYKCKHCTYGAGTGLTPTEASARQIWSRVNRIDINKLFEGLPFLLVGGGKICSGDLMAKLYNLWRYQQVGPYGLQSVIQALLDFNAVDVKFAFEVKTLIKRCDFDSDWTPFIDLYEKLTPMG